MLDIIFSQLVPLDSAQGVSLPMQKKTRSDHALRVCWR